MGFVVDADRETFESMELQDESPQSGQLFAKACLRASSLFLIFIAVSVKRVFDAYILYALQVTKGGLHIPR